MFDTAILTEGHLYQLDQHLQRFLTNAARANIPLPPGISAEQMRRTILETAAASCKLNGAGRCVWGNALLHWQYAGCSAWELVVWWSHAVASDAAAADWPATQCGAAGQPASSAVHQEI